MNPNGFCNALSAMGFASRAISAACSLFSPTRASRRKPICFSGKGCSGVRGKAYIEHRFIVGRGNMGVLFWPERHTENAAGTVRRMCEALLLAPAE
jgi:hypothetical protein